MNNEQFDKFIYDKDRNKDEAASREWCFLSMSGDEQDNYLAEKWKEASDHLPAHQQGRMYHRLMGAMGERATIERHQQSASSQAHWRWKWAAIAASLVLAVFLLKYIKQGEVDMTTMNYEVMAEKGQRATVTLPDGTRVWLNSDTKIVYKGNFGVTDRQLTLVGEAYFEVAKDADRRFVVSAKGVEVEALGTSFNIKAYQDDHTVTTTLITGRVKTRFNQRDNYLEPNQTLAINLRTLQQSKREVNVDHISMWRRNQIAFDGESFEEIAHIMNRMYNINVQFEDERVKKYRYVGTIRNNSLDNFLKVISLSTPVDYRYSGDTIYVRTRK